MPAMRHSRPRWLLALIAFLGVAPLVQPRAADIDLLIPWLLEEDRDLEGIPFPAVVKATTGKSILPFDRSKKIDLALLGKIEKAVAATAAAMNAADSAAHAQKRINEVSSHFEAALRDALNEIPGFECDYPKTSGGRVQRSGYPDLRLVDKTSRRVIYLDPKLYKNTSRSSSLRAFYFTPKRETNKILDDAHHLIVGFSHDGKHGDLWKFTGWELVDLSHFKVRLKAEFQGSNRDLYQEESVVGSGKSSEKE